MAKGWQKFKNKGKNYIGSKEVDYSSFNLGIRVPQDMREDFLKGLNTDALIDYNIASKSEIEIVLESETDINVKYVINNEKKSHDITYFHKSFQDGLARLIIKELPKSTEYILEQREQGVERPKLPEEYKGYINFYRTEELNRFKIDFTPCRASEIAPENEVIDGGNFTDNEIRRVIDGGTFSENHSESALTEEISKDSTIEHYPTFSGDTTKGEDMLHITGDVDAVAKLMASRDMVPPLAAGLFGEWGSGKSFFMEKVANRIDGLKDEDHEVFCGDVVHIRFNAWHYSDSNLWTSLAEHIFSSINTHLQGTPEEQIQKLYHRLNITTESVEKLNKQKKSVEEKIKEKEDAVTQKEKDISILKKGVKTIYEDENVKPYLDKLPDWILKDRIKDIENIEEEIGKLKEISSRNIQAFKVMWDELKSLKVGKRIYIIGMLFLIIGLFVLAGVYLENKGYKIMALYTGAGGFIISGLKVIYEFQKRLSKVSDGYEKLKNLKVKIESIEADKSEEIQELEREKEELEKDISSRQEEIDDIEYEIADIRQGKKIKEFIGGASDKYKDRVGIISVIRKDFEQLAKNIKEMNTDVPDEDHNHKKIERIVLYIDDLDRCKQERVIEVLEAVHLLLAFDLFVVMVGVDVKWVSQSLNSKYGILKDPFNEEEEIEDCSTTCDYLEKIFQIPIFMREVTKEGRNNLIDSVLGEDESYRNNYSDEFINESHRINEKDHEVINLNEEKEKLQEEIITEQSAASIEADYQQVKIQRDEVEFMRTISSLIGDTPRTIKRYINTYRIIRIHQEIQYKLKQKDGYKSIMLLLAIVVGGGIEARSIIEILEANRESDMKIISFIDDEDINRELKSNEYFEKLKEHLKGLEDILEMEIDDVMECSGLIKRFSFISL